MTNPVTRLNQMPPRFKPPSVAHGIAFLFLATLLTVSVVQVEFSLGKLAMGLPDMARIFAEMFPPDLLRLRSVGRAILETFEMALVGTGLGIVLSFPLGVLASRPHTPQRAFYHFSRALISLFRTVPDLVWALFFVVAVGLGPFAGTLAIMIDTIGFCGRFFAEAMEEVHPGPQEALRALGAGRTDIIFCAVVPGALPSLINDSLFSLEKATRSSVVLGLVGAGGIGIELKVAMEMFHYDQAATAILAIFMLVLVVEQTSAAIRRRII